jgi:flagellar FliJ protein
MAFRFSLATVLRVRESIEKREELALQRIQFEIAGVRRHIEKLNAEITNKHNARNKAMQKPVHANHLQAILNEVNAAIGKRQALIDSLQTLESERDRRTKAYQTAHTDRQMLTDILTQQENAYEREQTRIQQKQIDDIFASRLNRS